jgi:hypothetical protein
MANNVIEINPLRKIKTLENSITESTQIQIIKNSYLNKLQLYSKYSNINEECYELAKDISRRSRLISKWMQELKSLRKDIE